MLLAIATAVGFALRLAILGDSPFADELSTYWIVSENGLTGTWDVVHTDAEITPPLFFLLSELATKIDLTPEMARLPSLLAGTATIPLVYLVGDRTVGRRAALVAAVLAALSPFMTYYSAEARGYAVMIFCALVATLALLLVAEGRSRSWWIVYAFAAAGAMYTHYTAAFWLLAQFAWLLWARPALRRDALLANVGAAVLFAPWITGVLADFDSPTTEILSALEPFELDFVTTAISHWAVGFPYSVISLDSVPGTAALVLMGVGLAVAAVALLVQRRGAASDGDSSVAMLLRDNETVVLVVALALAAPLGEAVFSALSTDLLGTRNLAVSWAGLALAAGALLTAPRGPAAAVATACVIAGFALGAWNAQDNEVQKPDFKSTAEVVDEQAGPGDLVIDGSILSPGPLSGLDVQLAEPHRILRVGVPQQRERPFSVFDPVLPPAEIARRAARNAAGGRIVIATTLASEGGYGPQTEEIVRRLEARYEKTGEVVFPGVRDIAVVTLDPRSSADGGEDDVVGADAP